MIKRLQTDMKRIGFYTGEIDGKWGPQSEKAYRALVGLLDEASISDTTYIPVNIPIYDYTFKDSLYFINAEGYNVKMKKIEVYPKTVYRNITRTEYVEKFEREKRFGIGVQAGYGYNIYGNNFSPFIGIGISYNFIRF